MNNIRHEPVKLFSLQKSHEGSQNCSTNTNESISASATYLLSEFDKNDLPVCHPCPLAACCQCWTRPILSFLQRPHKDEYYHLREQSTILLRLGFANLSEHVTKSIVSHT